MYGIKAFANAVWSWGTHVMEPLWQEFRHLLRPAAQFICCKCILEPGIKCQGIIIALFTKYWLPTNIILFTRISTIFLMYVYFSSISDYPQLNHFITAFAPLLFNKAPQFDLFQFVPSQSFPRTISLSLSRHQVQLGALMACSFPCGQALTSMEEARRERNFSSLPIIGRPLRQLGVAYLSWVTLGTQASIKILASCITLNSVQLSPCHPTLPSAISNLPSFGYRFWSLFSLTLCSEFLFLLDYNSILSPIMISHNPLNLE